MGNPCSPAIGLLGQRFGDGGESESQSGRRMSGSLPRSSSESQHDAPDGRVPSAGGRVRDSDASRSWERGLSWPTRSSLKRRTWRGRCGCSAGRRGAGPRCGEGFECAHGLEELSSMSTEQLERIVAEGRASVYSASGRKATRAATSSLTTERQEPRKYSMRRPGTLLALGRGGSRGARQAAVPQCTTARRSKGCRKPRRHLAPQ